MPDLLEAIDRVREALGDRETGNLLCDVLEAL